MYRRVYLFGFVDVVPKDFPISRLVSGALLVTGNATGAQWGAV